MTLVTFLIRPDVLFTFGLVLLVVILGVVLNRVRLTGWHVFGLVALFFGIVIAANLVMASRAISTFPGLEVKNSYVASQEFNSRLKAQKALGWTLVPEYDKAAQELRLVFTDRQGFPSEVASLSVLVGRTTEAKDDAWPVFTRQAGAFVAPLNLARGKWMMQVDAVAADGTTFRQRIDLFVKG
tara:strand:- start:123 stop:671 length:549 start_codon:yes stop_codon:yes gene_type:complete